MAIADDHKIFRKGDILTHKSFSDLKFVFEATKGEELLKGIPEAKPDVVLLDLLMSGMDGIEATKKINEKYPDIKVLILTMFEDERFVYHLMESGANGYLLKNTDPSEIRRAIISAYEKGYFLNQFVNRILLKKTHERNKVVPSLSREIILTDKEEDVLRYI
ncbi:MAG: response regulator transcription factor [Chitinophagaceae bacterium]|nr:response regulator transcription factor [Chitinophagaceae bacterium]